MIFRRACLAVPLFLLAGCSSEPSDTYAGDVLSVVSADTMRISVDDEPRTVRVAGVRSPRAGECLYDEAMAAVEDLGAGDEVEVTEIGQDVRGTPLVRVVLPGGRDLATEVVAAGLAVADAEEEDLTAEMRKAREQAMEAEVGWFSSARECTFAGILGTATQALDEADQAQATTSAAAAAAVSGFAAAIAAADAAERFAHEAQRDLRMLAYPLARVSELTADLTARRAAAQSAKAAMESRQVKLEKAEKREAARKAKERARKKAEKAARAKSVKKLVRRCRTSRMLSLTCVHLPIGSYL